MSSLPRALCPLSDGERVQSSTSPLMVSMPRLGSASSSCSVAGQRAGCCSQESTHSCFLMEKKSHQLSRFGPQAHVQHCAFSRPSRSGADQNWLNKPVLWCKHGCENDLGDEIVQVFPQTSQSGWEMPVLSHSFVEFEDINTVSLSEIK